MVSIMVGTLAIRSLTSQRITTPKMKIIRVITISDVARVAK